MTHLASFGPVIIIPSIVIVVIVLVKVVSRHCRCGHVLTHHDGGGGVVHARWCSRAQDACLEPFHPCQGVQWALLWWLWMQRWRWLVILGHRCRGHILTCHDGGGGGGTCVIIVSNIAKLFISKIKKDEKKIPVAKRHQM